MHHYEEPTMDMPINAFKRAIKTGTLQIGLWSSLSDSISVEILAASGIDWILLDTEHAPNELPMVCRQLQAMDSGTAHPIVRPPWNDAVMIKRFLDAGAQTLLIPMVQTVEEARRVVAAARYPPHGIRGFASAARASGFGRISGYYERCQEEICAVVQIETRVALDNLEEIAGVEGIDGLFIGPGDLSADLGYLGNASHPEVVRVIDKAIARIRACGKPAGILTNEELAPHYIDRGCVFVGVGSDVGLLSKSASRVVETFARRA
jgi:4-hydroxy-2-oxoheptanedioate aldolase